MPSFEIIMMVGYATILVAFIIMVTAVLILLKRQKSPHQEESPQQSIGYSDPCGPNHRSYSIVSIEPPNSSSQEQGDSGSRDSDDIDETTIQNDSIFVVSRRMSTEREKLRRQSTRILAEAIMGFVETAPPSNPDGAGAEYEERATDPSSENECPDIILDDVQLPDSSTESTKQPTSEDFTVGTYDVNFDTVMNVASEQPVDDGNNEDIAPEASVNDISEQPVDDNNENIPSEDNANDDSEQPRDGDITSEETITTN